MWGMPPWNTGPQQGVVFVPVPMNNGQTTPSDIPSMDKAWKQYKKMRREMMAEQMASKDGDKKKEEKKDDKKPRTYTLFELIGALMFFGPPLGIIWIAIGTLVAKAIS